MTAHSNKKALIYILFTLKYKIIACTIGFGVEVLLCMPQTDFAELSGRREVHRGCENSSSGQVCHRKTGMKTDAKTDAKEKEKQTFSLISSPHTPSS